MNKLLWVLFPQRACLSEPFKLCSIRKKVIIWKRENYWKQSYCINTHFLNNIFQLEKLHSVPQIQTYWWISYSPSSRANKLSQMSATNFEATVVSLGDIVLNDRILTEATVRTNFVLCNLNKTHRVTALFWHTSSLLLLLFNISFMLRV